MGSCPDIDIDVGSVLFYSSHLTGSQFSIVPPLICVKDSWPPPPSTENHVILPESSVITLSRRMQFHRRWALCNSDSFLPLIYPTGFRKAFRGLRVPPRKRSTDSRMNHAEHIVASSLKYSITVTQAFFLPSWGSKLRAGIRCMWCIVGSRQRFSLLLGKFALGSTEYVYRRKLRFDCAHEQAECELTWDLRQKKSRKKGNKSAYRYKLSTFQFCNSCKAIRAGLQPIGTFRNWKFWNVRVLVRKP